MAATNLSQADEIVMSDAASEYMSQSSEDTSDSEDDLPVQDEEELEKDEAEEELERVIFGDSTGFRKELQQYSVADQAKDEPEALTLAGVQDSDLFFLDDAPTDNALIPHPDSDEDNLNATRVPLAWEDSDDERMQVSLMAVPRLRKLRNFDGEDVISGKDYIKRLRRQYESLNPPPGWTQWRASENNLAKRRRTSNDSSMSDDHFDSDDSLDQDNPSAQPLGQLLRTTQALTRTNVVMSDNRLKLRPEAISMERIKDIGPKQPHAITSLSVHPTMPLILTAGLSSTLYLHHLSPHPIVPDPANPLLTSLHIKKTPLTTALFSPAASATNQNPDPKIYLSARRRYFHTWHLPSGAISKTTRIFGEQKTTQRTFEVLRPSPCGRFIALQGTTRAAGSGVINILDATTTHWISQARVESRNGIANFAWWADGEGITILSRSGEISEWSSSERRILTRWTDESGGIGCTTLALGGRVAKSTYLGPDRYVAIGARDGIVHIYDRAGFPAPTDADAGNIVVRPAHRKQNLTTSITHLAFSPDGQVLCMASRMKRDALRLVHAGTGNVYKNWPTGNTPLGRVSALTWGEYSGFEEKKVLCLLVGNEAGSLRGWEVTG